MYEGTYEGNGAAARSVHASFGRSAGRRARVAAVFFLALALSACEYRTEVTVNTDGSGTLAVVMGFDKRFQGQTPSPSVADLPGGWAIEPYATDKVQGHRLVVKFSDPTELREKTRQAAQTERGGSFLLKDIELERTEGGWRFEGKVAAIPPLDVGGPGGRQVNPIPLTGVADVQIRVTLPGREGAHNATSTRTQGGKTTFAWKLAPDKRLSEARAETVPAGLPVIPIALTIGGVAAAVGAISVFLIFRRRRARPIRGASSGSGAQGIIISKFLPGQVGVGRRSRGASR